MLVLEVPYFPFVPPFLDEDIQQGPHDSVEDASTAMGIYRKVTGK